MPSDEEGFPHVLLESMATGTPFVASNVGAVQEITPSLMRNYLIRPGDIKTFSLRVTEILSKTPEELNKMRQSLKNYVELYDIHNAINKFAEMIL